MTTQEILILVQKSGIAHNNGAGGQFILVATESQLQKFADLLLQQEGPHSAEDLRGPK